MPSGAEMETTAMRAQLLPFLLIVALGTIPVEAQEMATNEDLVMRLIFEDCLGYIRNGTTPFEGLATRPASAAAVAELPGYLRHATPPLQLLSSRYVASWGSDEKNSYCSVRTVWDDIADSQGLLGVKTQGFISRLAKRAIAAGLTERDPGEAFSPVSTISFHEPPTGHDTGPLRPISFVVLPTEENPDSGLSDAGLLVMGGPPRR